MFKARLIEINLFARQPEPFQHIQHGCISNVAQLRKEDPEVLVHTPDFEVRVGKICSCDGVLKIEEAEVYIKTKKGNINLKYNSEKKYYTNTKFDKDDGNRCNG